MLRSGLVALVWCAGLNAQTRPEPKLPASPIKYTFSLPSYAGIGAVYVDPAGNVYFGGATGVALPVTPGAFQTAFNACPVIVQQGTLPRPACVWGFAGKLSPSGALEWLTYLAEPSGNSAVTEITADAAGNVYVAGYNMGVNNLPLAVPVTPGAFETTPGNVFIAELNPSGTKLTYATYFDGVASVQALLPDGHGNLFMAMRTESLVTLPLVNPLSGMAPSIESGYIAKLNATGSALLFASWVNGPGARSVINEMALDATGDLYLAGSCFYDSGAATPPCMPTTPGAYQTAMNGTVAMYVMKLTSNGGLIFSTFLGGSGQQQAFGMGVDGEGNPVIGGSLQDASAMDFPVTPGAFQTMPPYRGRDPALTALTLFVSKLDATGSKLLASTFFGGSLGEFPYGFFLDSRGNVVLGGVSGSPDLPMTSDGLEPCLPNPNFAYADPSALFLAELSPDESTLLYSTFLTPLANGNSPGTIVGIDGEGNVYLLNENTLLRYRFSARPKGSVACIADATYGYGSAIAPLGMIEIRGNDVSGGRTMAQVGAAGGMLPDAYQGLEVFINGQVAPLLAVAPDRITVVAPATLAGPSAIVEVIQNQTVTGELESPVQASVPAIITQDGTGIGDALAFNQDGSPNSHTNPAAPGSVVSVYLTGLGETDPVLTAGTVAVGPGTLAGATAQATFYGTPGTVLYAGPAPGLLAGFYQMNIQVPASGILDWVPFSVSVNGALGQSSSGDPDNVGIYVSCPAGSSCVLWN